MSRCLAVAFLLAIGCGAPPVPDGRTAFEQPLPGTNGRTCATCHALDDDTTLKPARVAARLAANPEDPLFHRLDADDPGARELTFEHVKLGLVRVVLPLPDNMDVIDAEGRVITAPDRKIFVWRGVPSVVDSALTAPYQLDGREATLEAQAQAAITNHSGGGKVDRAVLERLAAFQRGLLSPSLVDERFPLSPAAERGRRVYDKACRACHGGASTSRIEDREVHAWFSPALQPDGTVRFEIVDGKPVPVRRAPTGDFQNIGLEIATYASQVKRHAVFGKPAFNASVEMPRYRFRFYEDAARREPLVDLPPPPKTRSGDPFDPRPALDERGAPIAGPNLIAQAFTTDPGRAAITGDPADFEAFDVPSLRGASRTAPYFHDNSHETMRDVIDTYSRFIIPFTPPMKMPAVFPPETEGGRKEALSPEEKADLLAYLELL